MTWTCRQWTLDLSRTRIMGIVNLTPDSFSDGGRCSRLEAARSRVRTLLADGADLIDLGAESTRPGAHPLSWQTEWARLEPVLAVRAREWPDAVFSVDTYHPETARRALDAGVAVLNCVRADSVPAFIDLARATGCGLVLPCPMPEDFDALKALNPPVEQTVIDPMIGFSASREEDLARLGALRRLAQCAPVLTGVSRKRLIGVLTGADAPQDRLGGSVGAALWCAFNGASVLRVHDVKETKQALSVVTALAAAAEQTGGRPI